VRLHPLDPSAKCGHCGSAGLAYVRTRTHGDLYQCQAPTPCKGFTIHFRKYGTVCGIAAERSQGYLTGWVECSKQG